MKRTVRNIDIKVDGLLIARLHEDSETGVNIMDNGEPMRFEVRGLKMEISQGDRRELELPEQQKEIQ
jgi:hypothetical protein